MRGSELDQTTRRSMKRPSNGAFVGVLPATRTMGRRIEPKPLDESAVLAARSAPREDVALWPARDDDAFVGDRVVSYEIVPHDGVLHDVAIDVR